MISFWASSLPKYLAYQKQVGEQCAEMDRGIQIVDQLRADRGLGQNQLNGGEGIAGIAVQHRKERQVFFGRLEAFFFDR